MSERCIPWTGGINSAGYGVAWVDGIAVLAHRLAYEERHGPIPAGLTIDHLCRNRRCVNADHLEAITGRENTLRGTGPAARNARKTHCVNGHEFTPENTYHRSDRPGRACRACIRERARRQRQSNA